MGIAMIRLLVPDMTCGHCKAAVEAALQPIAQKVEIDLVAHEVRAAGVAPAAALAALEEVGFPATVLG